jgi:TolA-binding protein
MDAADLQATIQALKLQIEKLTVDAEQASKRQKDLECRVKELEDRTAVSAEPESQMSARQRDNGSLVGLMLFISMLVDPQRFRFCEVP